ncbi:MAG: hypothetical protein O4860_15915, partial [Trichodesmium sp. St2_bin2_1]|nr:hypothetical protein [Trichodesmium sp. St2_bin2_1]
FFSTLLLLAKPKKRRLSEICIYGPIYVLTPLIPIIITNLLLIPEDFSNDYGVFGIRLLNIV